jgi:hypothetical protein
MGNGHPGIGKSRLMLDLYLNMPKPWYMPRWLWRFWQLRKYKLEVISIPMTGFEGMSMPQIYEKLAKEKGNK